MWVSNLLPMGRSFGATVGRPFRDLLFGLADVGLGGIRLPQSVGFSMTSRIAALGRVLSWASGGAIGLRPRGTGRGAVAVGRPGAVFTVETQSESGWA